MNILPFCRSDDYTAPGFSALDTSERRLFSDWIASVHVFPAAYPRHRQHSSRPRSKHVLRSKAGERLSKEQIASTSAAIQDFQNSAKHQSDPSVKDECQLWICATRYRQFRTSATGMTLILAHANGLPRQTWEPALDILLQSTSTVSEIWSLDCVCEGDSALLNRGKLGDAFDWIDNGRDIANFVLHYLPDASTQRVPHQLPYQQADSISPNWSHAKPSDRPSQWRHRTIVGVGHSLGAASMITAASLLPSIFTRVIAVEAVLRGQAKLAENQKMTDNIVRATIARRDVWPKSDVESTLAKSAFFGAWHPKVLEGFVSFGLCDGQAGQVELKTTKIDEAIVFAQTRDGGPAASMQRISCLSPHIHLCMLWAAQSTVFSDGQREANDLASQNCHTHVVQLEGARHLVVMENPALTGKQIAYCLDNQFDKARL